MVVYADRDEGDPFVAVELGPHLHHSQPPNRYRVVPTGFTQLRGAALTDPDTIGLVECLVAELRQAGS